MDVTAVIYSYRLYIALFILFIVGNKKILNLLYNIRSACLLTFLLHVIVSFSRRLKANVALSTFDYSYQKNHHS